jgi:hypothetical protein
MFLGGFGLHLISNGVWKQSFRVSVSASASVSGGAVLLRFSFSETPGQESVRKGM